MNGDYPEQNVSVVVRQFQKVRKGVTDVGDEIPW